MKNKTMSINIIIIRKIVFLTEQNKIFETIIK